MPWKKYKPNKETQEDLSDKIYEVGSDSPIYGWVKSHEDEGELVNDLEILLLLETISAWDISINSNYTEVCQLHREQTSNQAVTFFQCDWIYEYEGPTKDNCLLKNS